VTLRVVVVALLVANLGYAIWARGGLAMFGSEPARFSEREPQRLQQQVRPQVLLVKPAAPPITP
jgi:hypothetical protein